MSVLNFFSATQNLKNNVYWYCQTNKQTEYREKQHEYPIWLLWYVPILFSVADWHVIVNNHWKIHIYPYSSRYTLTKKKFIQVCYKYTSFKLKIRKYTFSLLFMYFSKMYFRYFSEIYLNCTKVYLTYTDRNV